MLSKNNSVQRKSSQELTIINSLVLKI